MMRKMKKLLSFGLLTMVMGAPVFADKVIGILVPIALPAMDQIVSGYETELQKSYPEKITFLVKNAEGSAIIQQSILQSFFDQQVDIIAPIGTSATQMAVHLDQKNIPIVAIAAERPASLSGDKPFTNVLDEVSVATQIGFIHEGLPELKKMTLIYSADDRMFADVKASQVSAKSNGIALQTLMVQQLPDLYTVKSHIDDDTQAIFVLKDEMVVSGIQTLVQVAQHRQIPLIASDDGSVEKGAAFSLGVRESDIGKYAAIATAKVLNGVSASSIPEFVMTDYTVFVNESSAKLQGMTINVIQSTAKKQGISYDVVTA
jgi:putative ABC transport system substrate-binding protein